MGLPTIPINSADRFDAEQRAKRIKENIRQRERQSNAVADAIENYRIDWNLLDVSDKNMSAGISGVGLTVEGGVLTLPLQHRKTGAVKTLLGPGGAVAGSIKAGPSRLFSVKLGGKNGITINMANEIAKQVPAGGNAEPVFDELKILSEAGAPIFKGPSWQEEKDIEQLAGPVSVLTTSLIMPSRELLGVINFVKKIFTDRSSLFSTKVNAVGIFFIDTKSPTTLTRGGTYSPGLVKAMCFCRTTGHSAALLGVAQKRGIFMLSVER